MPFAGREILPRLVYGAIYEEMVAQGVDEAMEAAIRLTATSMFEAGTYSKIRDAAIARQRAAGTPEDKLSLRYWVLYEKATYVGNSDGSIDRGVLMFNDKYQPQVTDEEAFSFQDACREGVSLYKRAGLGPWYGWRDIMNPDAIEKMRTDPNYPYARHLDGATMRWRRTYLAAMNYHLSKMSFPLIPATFFE